MTAATEPDMTGTLPRYTGGPLHPDHIAACQAEIDLWTGNALSTERCDRPAAEAAVADAYRAAGLDTPGVVVWADSPLGGLIAAGQLGGQLGGQLRDQLGDQLRGLAYWGFASAAWGHHYRWISTIAPKPPPAEQLTLLDHWINASSAGVWLPLNGVAIMSEKHTACHVDGNGSLHHETHPAWEWADGTKIWAWRGTRVPEWVITDCTLDRIGSETNTEIRRCAIEHYGWDRYLTSIGAAPVDEADDPGNPGHVLRLFDTPEQIYSEPTRLLVMSNASLDRDGTRRTYAETVPAEIGSAVAAAAWQFGVDADMYRQLERAT